MSDVKRRLFALGLTLTALVAMTGLFIICSRLMWGEWPW